MAIIGDDYRVVGTWLSRTNFYLPQSLLKSLRFFKLKKTILNSASFFVSTVWIASVLVTQARPLLLEASWTWPKSSSPCFLSLLLWVSSFTRRRCSPKMKANGKLWLSRNSAAFEYVTVGSLSRSLSNLFGKKDSYTYFPSLTYNTIFRFYVTASKFQISFDSTVVCSRLVVTVND